MKLLEADLNVFRALQQLLEEQPKGLAARTLEPRARGADAASNEADKHSILIGIAEEAGRDVTVPLEDLRRHTVVFAGSGSGKTVLIRRLIEECALKGVSAIVLDPNNDLVRFGLPWPAPPQGWLDGDAEKAATYLRDTEVVVRTPRLTTPDAARRDRERSDAGWPARSDSSSARPGAWFS